MIRSDNTQALSRLQRRLQIAVVISIATIVIPLTIVAYKSADASGDSPWLPTLWAVLFLAGLPAALLFGQAFGKIRQVMQRLWHSEQHWRQLMALSGDWYWEQDVEGRIVNILYRGLSQSDHDQSLTPLPFVGSKRWDVPGLESCSMDWEAFRQLIARGEPFERMQFLYTTQAGQRIYFESTGRPVKDANGMFVGYKGVSVNTTQRALNEKLLHAERQFLKGMLISVPMSDLLSQLTPAMADTLSHRGDVALWFSGGEEPSLSWHSCTNPDLKVPPALASLSHDTVRALAHPLNALFDQTDSIVLNREQHADAWPLIDTHYHSAIFIPVRIGNTRLGALIAVLNLTPDQFGVRDMQRMTDAARMLSVGLERLFFESELQSLNKHLEDRIDNRTAALVQTNKELEAFTYTVSHDLRAPLRAIDGFSGILMEDFNDNLPEDAQRLLARISNNARQMGELIDGLLDFSRLLKTDVCRVNIKTADMVARVCEQLNAHERARVVIDPLPDAVGDPVLIQQIWMNLIDNALKFSNKAEQPSVHISATSDDRFIEYSVSDNGAGFDMAYKEKLFNVFERLHHKKDFDGTGVGLATVKRILERHGGSVSATGEQGKGACFKFRLPVGAVDAL